MKLEWFRQHKKFVYYILLPVVGGGMAFFGLGTALRSRTFAPRMGPSIGITLDGRTRVMDPSEVLALRMELAHFFPRVGNVSSDDAAAFRVKYLLAARAGFEAGSAEMKDRLREMVKWQVAQREGDSDPKITPEVYSKLLQQMQVTSLQFEQLTRRVHVSNKYDQLVTTAEVSDPELFVEYCHDKEYVRLRYQELKSEDFMAKVEAPSAEKVEKFYNESKDKPENYKEVLMTDPKMSADMLFYNPAKLVAELKPTDVEIKNYYDRFKGAFWIVPPKEGEPAPAPGKETYKPLETVKAEVVQKWTEENKGTRIYQKISDLKTDLEKAEKAHAEAESKKAEKDRQPFDLAAWAKAHELEFWTTGELTELQFRAGKKGLEAVKAPNADSVQHLFYFTKPLDPRMMRNPQQARMMNEYNKKALEEFRQFAVEPAAPEKGFVLARKKTFTPEKLKPLDDARGAIANYLKVSSAIELAGKEANKLREDWARGDNLPEIDKLNEVAGNSRDSHALLREFFGSAKAVGEVLDVAEAPADMTPDTKNEHVHFYVGFPVERKLPTWTTFQQDTEWDREQARRKIATAKYRFAQVALRKSIGAKISIPRDIHDVPLFEQYNRGGPVDDGDY
jgi:hypothetical protein